MFEIEAFKQFREWYNVCMLPDHLKTSNPMKQSFFTCVLAALLVSLSVPLMSQNKVGVGDVFPGRVEFAAFTLAQDDQLSIEGRGGAFHHDWQMIVYYGWIIDSETRKVVWHAADKADRPDFEYGEFNIRDQVSLKKGTYEIYFAAAYHHENNTDWTFTSLNGLFNDIFGDRKRDRENFRLEFQEGMGMEVSAPSLTKVSAAGIVEKKISEAIVAILKPDNNANIKKGFSLSGETTLRIYGIGEGRKDETFDYAWIYDLDKHKRVWVMDYGNSSFAGGADKNMIVDEKITLPAGNYLVSYATDDSHSYNNWNAMPPHDPQFSGITIWPNSDSDKKNVVPFKAVAEVKPVLQIVKVHDDEYLSRGLSVKAPTEFRVFCIGESTSDEMADNGWIVNAATGQVVWDMSREHKEHAGGASKNKMVDQVIKLEKGDYIVRYATDDSHSYGDWNSGPPHEQDFYGITLWVNKKEDLSKISTFEPAAYKNDRVVAEIVRVRDDENLSENFRLDKETNVRIIAIGEGVDGDMVDFGWIKNTDTGRVVWEMTYRNTDSAGGAHKNRLFNDTITLPAGNYKVYYETDGSHSYRSWNATPPRDPERYGISLMKE